jgi:basic membrane lipoprotein Med (substrate-binding protein (PBP1-ABC) superfamily)
VASVVLAGTALAAFAVRAGGPGSASAHPLRIALIVPRLPKAGDEDISTASFLDGLALVARQYGAETEVLPGDERHVRTAVQQRTAERIRHGRFDLVIVARDPTGGVPLDRAIFALPKTRFLFVDANRVAKWRAQRQPNVTLVRFADAQSGYLAGYLGGLLERSTAHRPVLSVIGVRRRRGRLPQVEHLVDGFIRGMRRADPEAAVVRSWSPSFTDRAECARLAMRQIDAGSTLIFAPAGTCELGALDVAGLRGVHAIGVDQDFAYLGSHVVASTVKRYDRAVLLGVRWYLDGTLPRGGALTLGLDQDAVGLTGISPAVPSAIRAAVAGEAVRLRHESAG